MDKYGMEIWADIPGWEGKYQVSTWGRVCKATDSTRCILNPERTPKGYLRVNLYNTEGERKHFKVHRLVALTFIPNELNCSDVNHKDGNKENNSVTNLEWCTSSQNREHAVELRRKRKEWMNLCELNRQLKQDMPR